MRWCPNVREKRPKQRSLPKLLAVEVQHYIQLKKQGVICNHLSVFGLFGNFSTPPGSHAPQTQMSNLPLHYSEIFIRFMRLYDSVYSFTIYQE